MKVSKQFLYHGLVVKIFKGLSLVLVFLCCLRILAYAQQGVDFIPKPIVIDEPTETLEERMTRKITLDVREMNIVDVLKFLALKGDFNIVTSGNINGRITLYLKSVSIKDALDIILVSSALAYHVQNDIVQILTGPEYEAIFGKRYDDKNKVEIIQLKYAKPSYVLAALDNIKSSVGKIIIDEDTGSVVLIDTPQTLVNLKKAIEDMEKPMEVVVYSLKYAKADVVAEKLQQRIDAHAVGSITTDERSNKLVVRALPARKDEVLKILKELDMKTPEVLIEARILQVVLKPTFDMGIDWQLDFRDSKINELKKVSFENVFLDESGLTSSDNLSSVFSKIGVGNFDVDEFEIALRALKQVSDTRIISNPKILVTNNEEAKIHIGDTVPYIISTTSGTGDNAITSEDVRFVDVGLQFNVTPTINEDGYVTMRLNPEISSVVDSIESEGGGIPQVNKTEVETTVLVKDGTTIVLGGLRSDNKVHVKRGLPFLMDIPFLGRMFSVTTDSMNSTEIIMFITPHIVSGNSTYLDQDGTIKPLKSFDDQREKGNKKGLSLGIKE